MGDPREGNRLPRWAKLAGIAAAILLLVILVVMLTRGGGHERPSHGDGGGGTAPANVSQTPPTGHTPPRHD